ncbi:MAG TPA: hypothetical protein VFX16_25110 [Pseudonocardiaceae bacterium]|nr:hypothetical protein [Pseudonocardiaceae bacterium]
MSSSNQHSSGASREHHAWPPLADVREGAKLTLAGLGVALRDAVAQVYDDLDQDPGGTVDLHDPGRGVRLHLASPQDGAVLFDWPEVGSTITYRWTVDRVRLAIVDEPPVPVAHVRERLLRLDRVDAPLREQWAASGFHDPDLGQRLTTLTAAGVTWLREVLTEHGWRAGRRWVWLPRLRRADWSSTATTWRSRNIVLNS